jgi:NCK-associated protein 1
MDRLICLVRKYAPAGQAFAIGYVAAAAQRMQQLLVGQRIVAIDIDTELHELFSSIFGALEQLPKLENDQVVPSSTDLSVFRRSWLQLIMLVSSSRSAINIQHLDMAIVSAEGSESIVTEGNRAYLWSRSLHHLLLFLARIKDDAAAS